jgi:hypothetical protein
MHNPMEPKDWLWLIVMLLTIATFAFAVLSGQL